MSMSFWLRSATTFAFCVTSVFGASVANPFDAAYTLVDLGSVSGVSTNYGGVTFLNGSTMLLGANANTGNATIQAIQVARDGNGHITSFGNVSPYATAPNVDGGLAFGPGGVLFATGYSNNTLMEFLPGSTSPDKTITLPGASNSVGTIQFIPAGNPYAGNVIIGSYSVSKWFTGTLTPDGNGTFDLTDFTQTEANGNGPEGIIYVPSGSPLFSGSKALVSEYGSGAIQAYDVNAFGAPTGTGVDFVTGLTGAEGATLDPVTGDFIFSTFGGGNHIIEIQGFAVPAGDTPEPSTFGLLAAALVAAGVRLRRNRL